jgi:signal transduction histidine kinase
VTWGPSVALLAVVGLAGLVLLAPWATVAVAGAERQLARWLLAPSREGELSRRVEHLEASRTAAVDSAEAERRRIERDLHDGAQQRLVSLAMDLGQAAERFDTDLDTAKELVVEAHHEAKAALSDLRSLVRGFHPAILEDRGLDAALSALVARSPVPVALDVDVRERPSAAVESTAYFVVAEALTNVAKHARATKAGVAIARHGDRLVVEVTDDGVGGADPAAGTGLRGLAERVAAVDGWMRVLSPAGGPTSILVEIPCGS